RGLALRGVGTAVGGVLHLVAIAVALARPAATAVHRLSCGSVGTAIRLVLDLILVLIGGVTEQKAETCLHAEIHVVVDGPGRGAGHVVDGTIELDAELLAEPQAKSEDASDAILIVVGVLPV